MLSLLKRESGIANNSLKRLHMVDYIGQRLGNDFDAFADFRGSPGS